jgi:hypothetical protein
MNDKLMNESRESSRDREVVSADCVADRLLSTSSCLRSYFYPEKSKLPVFLLPLHEHSLFQTSSLILSHSLSFSLSLPHSLTHPLTLSLRLSLSFVVYILHSSTATSLTFLITASHPRGSAHSHAPSSLSYWDPMGNVSSLSSSFSFLSLSLFFDYFFHILCLFLTVLSLRTGEEYATQSTLFYSKDYVLQFGFRNLFLIGPYYGTRVTTHSRPIQFDEPDSRYSSNSMERELEEDDCSEEIEVNNLFLSRLSFSFSRKSSSLHYKVISYASYLQRSRGMKRCLPPNTSSHYPSHKRRNIRIQDSDAL